MAKSNSILAICYVTENKFKIDPATGGAIPDGESTYYFQSSSIYADPVVAKATGVNYIDPNKWEGLEPLIKIDQLILSNKLIRVYAELENPDPKKNNKVVGIFVTPALYPALNLKATGFIGTTLKTVRGNTTTTLGKVFGTRGKTHDRYN